MHRTGLAVLLALASAAVAQPQKPVPTAITNARVVVSADKTLAKATVLLRDGLIADVIEGDAQVPPDALVIDGTGLTVYPGLIDSYTNLALPEPAPGPSPGGGPGAFLLVQPQTRAVGGPNSTQPAA